MKHGIDTDIFLYNSRRWKLEISKCYFLIFTSATVSMLKYIISYDRKLRSSLIITASWKSINYLTLFPKTWFTLQQQASNSIIIYCSLEPLALAAYCNRSSIFIFWIFILLVKHSDSKIETFPKKMMMRLFIDAHGVGEYYSQKPKKVVKNGVIFRAVENGKCPGRSDKKWVKTQFSIEIFLCKFKSFLKT